MKLIKPPRLKKRDTIGVISPSAGVAGIIPHRLDRAIQFLQQEGYHVKEFSCTRKNAGYESAPAKERAKDIMAAFLDKEVNAILCTIGGNTGNKVLEHLDYQKIRQHPKIFCGYSDISVFHYAFQTKAGLVTFYGPSAMNQFAEFPQPLEHTLQYFRKAVFGEALGRIEPSKSWTDEVLDWGKKKDLERPRQLQKNPGYQWLRPGKAEGRILGGRLTSIDRVLGTEYWPNHKDAILFLELPEGSSFDQGTPLEEADALLCKFRLADIFKEIKGLIVGRPFRYNAEQVQAFQQVILENTAGYKFPILYGADIGHTDPQITIPLGVNTPLDSRRNVFEIFEAGTV